MLINKSIFSDTQGNELRLSSIIQTEQKVSFQKFSVKYVVSGKEEYTLNKRKIKLNQGEYVVGNQHLSSSVLIDNTTPVKGICIDIAKDYITTITDYQFQNPIAFHQFMFEQDWMAQKYNVKNTSLGYALKQLSAEFDNLNDSYSKIDNELFFALAECIVNDQSAVFKDFSKLKSVKQETNGRLFNFICDAKNYIDEAFLDKINIDLIAKEAKLSEYHFIRLFKTIFNTTPYQYIIKKRLDYSKELLLQNYTLEEIAFLTSFADSASFCKTFKSKFGCTPKQFILAN